MHSSPLYPTVSHRYTSRKSATVWWYGAGNQGCIVSETPWGAFCAVWVAPAVHIRQSLCELERSCMGRCREDEKTLKASFTLFLSWCKSVYCIVQRQFLESYNFKKRNNVLTFLPKDSYTVS